MNLRKKIIIAIDGYSSCGKSTFAKMIAKLLHYKYIDSGAMYRALTLLCLRHNILQNNDVNAQKLSALLKNFHLDFSYNQDTKLFETYMYGVNIEEEIRNVKVAEYVSHISKIPEVREKMIRIQRDIGKNKGVVMDGRDIGSVVFPKAEVKIFMTADVKIRAQRRYKELIEKGLKVSLEEIEKNIQERDYIDEHRKISPLIPADDAIILDNTNMTPEQQLEWFKDVLLIPFK